MNRNVVRAWDSDANKARFNYRAKKLYQIRIECEYFQPCHRFTHKLICQSLSTALSIDNVGNIEVFYIYESYRNHSR